LKQKIEIPLLRAGVIFLLLLLSFAAQAQRTGYYIRNYPPAEYKGFNQVWQIAQDKNGLMYFAGTSNIFIFSGQEWETVPVKSGAANRQIVIDPADGTIYVAAVGDFGYLRRDAKGKYVYVSLIDQLNEKQRAFADVWKIFISGKDIYFQATERIFIVRGKKVLDVIEATTDKGFALSFGSSGRLYVRQRTVGLLEIKGKELLALPGGEAFANMRLLGMMPWSKNEQLILSGENGFFLLSDKPDPATGSLFRPFPLPPDSFLLYGGPLGCEWVNDSIFAVNSRVGVGFYTKEGRLKEVLDKSSGIGDGAIAEMHVDNQRNLWLVHNNGITRIAYNSPARLYGDKTGFSGTAEFMFRYKDELYLASSEGLFRASGTDPQKPSSLRFTPTPVQRTEVWDALPLDDRLLLGTSLGMVSLQGDKAELLSDFYTNRIRKGPKPGEIITAEKGGLSIFSMLPGKKPEMLRTYELPGTELIRFGRVDTVKGKPGYYQVWAATRFKETVLITFGLRDSSITLRPYGVRNGIPVIELYMVYIGDSAYFCNPQQVFRYLPARDKDIGSVCFAPAPDIFKRLHEGDVSGVRDPLDFRLHTDAFTTPHLTCYGHDEQGRPVAKKLLLASLFLETGVQSALIDKDDWVWVMSNELIVRYNSRVKPDSNATFQTLIRKVSIGKDSVIFFGSDSTQHVNDAQIDYSLNTVAFRFAGPQFGYDEKMYFMYRLDGYDTAWSKPTQVFEKDYTNLREGTYTFRVQGIGLFGKPGKETSYTFTILPPWYRTGWAYAVYALAFLIIVYAAVKLSVRRLEKAKQHLERVVSERTAEVERQKTQLEAAFTDIRDSIHYAKRIQDAILPLDEQVTAVLPELFVLLYPRDIVSGDFYWFARRGEKAFVACVDCTGHGVPGALMSMIGNTLLNEIVIEKGVEQPAAILQRLHQRVREALKQNLNSETRDGMDISLCVVHTDSSEMEYAGANRPVFIVRNGQLIELDPDKYSIGGYQGEEDRTFTSRSIRLEKEDRVYLFSDGYPDQFGGEKGKKFMIKRFREMILSAWRLPVKEQQALFDRRFLEWKSGYEQTDDVLVIGFKYLG